MKSLFKISSRQKACNFTKKSAPLVMVFCEFYEKKLKCLFVVNNKTRLMWCYRMTLVRIISKRKTATFYTVYIILKYQQNKYCFRHYFKFAVFKDASITLITNAYCLASACSHDNITWHSTLLGNTYGGIFSF